jgi:hypothetical protein
MRQGGSDSPRADLTMMPLGTLRETVWRILRTVEIFSAEPPVSRKRCVCPSTIFASLKTFAILALQNPAADVTLTVADQRKRRGYLCSCDEASGSYRRFREKFRLRRRSASRGLLSTWCRSWLSPPAINDPEPPVVCCRSFSARQSVGSVLLTAPTPPNKTWPPSISPLFDGPV